MSHVTVHEDKTYLSRLTAVAPSGSDVMISQGRSGQGLAKLGPVKLGSKRKGEFGWLSHETGGSDLFVCGFWDPMPTDEQALWTAKISAMRPLFDAYAPIWAAHEPELPFSKAEAAIEDSVDPVYVSAASVMEIATRFRSPSPVCGEDRNKE
jgi:hypothetical protein